jgi:hypothetical protein
MRELVKDRILVEEESNKSDYELDKKEIEVTKINKMKCQRVKIDGKECRSKLLSLDNTASGYFRLIPVCSRCYKDLLLISKRKKFQNNLFLTHSTKCLECGKTILQTNDKVTNLCKTCFREKRKLGCFKRNSIDERWLR